MEENNNGNETSVKKIKDNLENLEKKVKDMGRKAAGSAVKMKANAAHYQDEAAELLDSLAKYIDENPQKATIIAAATGLGIGIIVGLLLRNRN